VSDESTSDLSCTEYEVRQVGKANATGKQPVVFVHGLWLLPSSWDLWRQVFEEAGYVTVAPGWPDDPLSTEEAKEHPEVFARKSVGQVADHYEEVIQALERKPAVIGHSFGGLLTEILAGRGRGRFGRDQPGAVPRRPTAAVLGAEVGVAGAPQPGEPQSGGSSHLRPVQVRVREHA
jgi:pimeloyl-ACP methyl ester carboxylesterase